MIISAIERLSSSDLHDVSRLLADAGLPGQDTHHADNLFFGLRSDHELIACGGLQIAETDVLLRSLVVKPGFQGRGLGQRLVEHLLRFAADAGYESVYLLTESSDPYFAAQGFETINRGSVPAAIGKTAQFAELCPDSAVCMSKNLKT